MKVVVTGAGALLGQGIIRSLQAATIPVHVVALDPSSLAPGLYWADEAHKIPMVTDPAYGDRIDELLSAVRPDAVLVGTDVELGFFARERTRLEQAFGGSVVVSSPRVLEIADDKWKTAEWLRQEGFPHPMSCLPGDEESLIDQVGFPLVVKPRTGARSVGVHVVGNRSELAAALAHAHSAPVIQEYLGTAEDEYTAGVLCFDGEVDATIVMRRDLRDGNTYRAWVREYPELNMQVSMLAAALRPFGPANFQFRVVKGIVKVFEINGRFSGTTPFRLHAGLNEVERTLRRVVLGERPQPPEIRPVVILRHWTETVLNAAEILA